MQPTRDIIANLALLCLTHSALALDPIAVLAPNDVPPNFGTGFGRSVAISGNYIAVGAPDDSWMNGNAVGAVYVFRRVGANWVQQAKLTPPDETPDADYPFILTTGRNLYQYHSDSMSRRVQPIEAHAGKPYVEINPADGKKLHVTDGETISVVSRRGKIKIKARITPKVSEGTVFIPMHYREAAANVITNDALDAARVGRTVVQADDRLDRRHLYEVTDSERRSHEVSVAAPISSPCVFGSFEIGRASCRERV